MWGKVVCWNTKAAISLKRVKIEEKLLWMAYKNSPTLFRTVPSPTPYGFLLPKIRVRKPTPKLQSKIASVNKGMICMADLQELTNALSDATIFDPLRPSFFLDWRFATPPKTSIAIISGTGKAMDFKFGWHIHRMDRIKSP